MTLTVAAITIVVTLMSCLGLTHLLHRFRLFDIPGERSSHAQPTLRGGGIGVALGLTVAAAASSRLVGWQEAAMLTASLGFGAIGLLDDALRGVAVRYRLVMQTLVAVTCAPLLLDHSGGATALRLVEGVCVVIGLIGYVNVFNFMDGINGLSVAQAIVAGAAYTVIGYELGAETLEVAGGAVSLAALAFLPFNFPRARLFLGDVGSYCLGGWLGALAILGLRAGAPLEAALAPFLIYVADAGTTLLKRIRRRDEWTKAHREHVYQRLVIAGWSHTLVTLTLFVLIAVCAGLGLVSLNGDAAVRAAADVGGLVVLAMYLTLPIVVERRAKADALPSTSPQRSLRV